MVQRQTILKTGVMVLLFLTLVTPMVAGAQPAIADSVEEMFLGPGQEVDSYYMLMFGIVLPVLLVFAIIHKAMSMIWTENKKEAAVVSFIFALFPLPTGLYQYISQALLALSDVMVGGTTPDVAFRGTILYSMLFSGMPAWLDHLVIAMFVGGTLMIALAFFGRGEGEAVRELRKHEWLGITILTGAIWMFTGGSTGYSNSLEFLGLIMVFGIGVFLLFYHFNYDSTGSYLHGFLGLVVLGWAMKSLGQYDKYAPDFVTSFGDAVLTTVGWLIFAVIAFVILGFILLFHLN